MFLGDTNARQLSCSLLDWNRRGCRSEDKSRTFSWDEASISSDWTVSYLSFIVYQIKMFFYQLFLQTHVDSCYIVRIFHRSISLLALCSEYLWCIFGREILSVINRESVRSVMTVCHLFVPATSRHSPLGLLAMTESQLWQTPTWSLRKSDPTWSTRSC